APAVAAAPTGPAAAAGGPSPENIPPRPTHAPATPPANNPSVLPQTATDRPAADRPATDRSAAPRDTAAFHLANSGALWNGDPKRPGTARTADEAAPDDL
ncbi:hypothetical protein ADK48_22295, partial [Streptomyces rimosus subsp. rimosus]